MTRRNRPLNSVLSQAWLHHARFPIFVLVFLAGFTRSGDFSAERWEHHVRALADPALEGRALGSKGAERAAAYIEARFREYGLDAIPGIGTRASFPVTLDLALDDSSAKNAFSIAGPGSFAPLTLHRDYQPLPFSGNGSVQNAQIVFGGYAISAPELDYDDFEGLDVRGRVVIAFRREPQEKRSDSRFRGLDFTNHAAFAAKAKEVARRGGVALVIVTNRLPDEENDDLPQFSTSEGPGKLNIPVLLARAPALAPFFVEQGMDLGSLDRSIDKSGKPQSFAFRPVYRATVRVSLLGKAAQGFNVMAWKPGQTNEYVIVGAHYDHIGFGKRFSMEPGDRGKIHPGADDNASGVAAMLELARRVAKGPALRRGVLFVGFGGEEHGLFGSTYLLQNPPSALGKLAGMINFDMVGRLREDELFIAGLESVPELQESLSGAAEATGIKIERITEYPYNMSDHGTFLEAGVPAVLFFTGLHLEYHTARDTADRVLPDGAIRVLAIAYKALHTIADAPQSLPFVPGMDPGYRRGLREIASPPNPYNQE